MPAPFRIYNSLNRRAEPFVPSTEGHVGLYVCGMTVYDHAHVGHGRAMVVFDTFVRYLQSQGWTVTFVRNFTDIDDKIIRRAGEQGVPPQDLADHYIDAFQQDCAAMGLLPPTHEPRVSESLNDIRDMIERLIDGGHAYAANGSVWFDVASFPDYGALSGQDVHRCQGNPEPDPAKRSPHDFALWKGAKTGEPAWPSPWGEGRPGWHIECSAMSRRFLGDTIDVHGGGIDLVFPHHENEIAQSVCANKADYVRYWMHNGLITLVKASEDGTSQDAKMGKSLGNVVNLRDALQDYPAEALRLYYLQAHYRSPLPWTPDALNEALSMLARLYEARALARSFTGQGDASEIASSLGRDAQEVLSLARSFSDRWHHALRDDLNTAAALGHAFELARAINRLGGLKKARGRAAPVVAPALQALALLEDIGLLTLADEAFDDEVKHKRGRALGLDLSEVEALIAARRDARANKQWAEADALRDKLDALGVVLMDAADGAVRWKLRLTS